MEPTNALTNILAQVASLTTVVGDVFSMITANAYLCFFAAVGLVVAAIRIFRKLKKAAR